MDLRSTDPAFIKELHMKSQFLPQKAFNRMNRVLNGSARKGLAGSWQPKNKQ
jgi:hypothetical protein